MVLLVGFGPFGDVTDNPAGRLARALDGRRVAGETIVGRVIPVSYARGPDATIAIARATTPRWVLGIGVAVGRHGPEVEAVAAPHADPARLDVDGARRVRLGDAPVHATLDSHALADALGASVSHDAGAYVCNAWLYAVTRALSVPVGFLHIPAAGIAPDRLADALRAL